MFHTITMYVLLLENDDSFHQIAGYLVMHGGSKEMKKCYAVDGIRMAEYMERYEAKNLTKIHHKDRAKLTQLTSKTLFCRYCYQVRLLLRFIKVRRSTI